MFVLARSSTHTAGTSERLSSSSQRARFLGMVVGVAISQLTDKPESRLKFDFPESEQKQAQWYQSLVYVDDHPSSVSELKPMAFSNVDGHAGDALKIKKPLRLKQREVKSERPKITVVEDSEDDDDLMPYAKPDSDAEDSDEDATLTRRNKPKAPVYVDDKFPLTFLSLDS